MATVKAYGKINWILNIVGAENGYHMLDGVMENIDLYDIVSVDIRKDEEIHTTYKDMDNMVGDLCYKAACCFYEETAIKGGADIYVEKNIPMGAGLGGGSSDCCAVLCLLNDHYNNPLSKEQLHTISDRLGADIPFFIDGGAQRARGKGEVLSRLEDIQPMNIIVARPLGKGVSTPSAFRLYDSMEEKTLGNVDEAIRCLKEGDIEGLGKAMYNSLETPSIQLLPEIAKVKEALLKAGAIQAVMTGSGSAVIGLIGEREIDKEALKGFWYRECKTIKVPREVIK